MSQPGWEFFLQSSEFFKEYSRVYIALGMCPTRTSLMCPIQLRGSNENPSTMHNFFLGTAKRVFMKWIEDDSITREGLQTIQARIEEISSLSDIGRLPGNIKSN